MTLERTSPEQYLNLIQEEFLTKIGRIKLFTNHAPSIGFGNEEILRNFLKTHIPERFAVGTGFVYLDNDNVSRQCDLLIYDRLNYAPFFKEGDFVIIHPEAVAAVVEVKTTLKKEELYDSIDNIRSVKEVAKKAKEQGIKCHISGFSFIFTTRRQKLATVKNWLQSYPELLSHELSMDMITILGEVIFYRPKSSTSPDFVFRKMDKKDDFSFPMFFGMLMGALELKRVITEMEFIDKRTSPVKKDFAAYIQRYVNIFNNPNRTWYRPHIQIGVPAKPYEEDLIEAHDYISENPRKALKYIESAIQKGCNILKLFGDKGFLLLKMGRFEEYVKYFSEVYSKFDSTEWKEMQKELLMFKAEAESCLRCWEDALKTYEILISTYPSELDFNIGKTQCLIGLGEYDNAIKICDEILSHEPHKTDLLINKGLAMKKKGDSGYKAIVDKVINDNSNSYNKAAAYAILDDKKEMLRYLKQVIKEEPMRKFVAKYDLEFDEFRNDKDFKKVLRGVEKRGSGLEI